MSKSQKSAIITFLGNAYHDSRVVNLIDSLEQINISTKTISFDWKSEKFKTIIGQTSIYKLEKDSSRIKFYFYFLYLLTRDLIKSKADYYFAEDIYTLPIVYFFAKKNNAKIFYNSREIYAHLAGLRNKSFIQKIIASLENKFIRKVDQVFVTGEMDADYLRNSYNINNLFVLRNLPKFIKVTEKIDLHEKLNIPQSSRIILYQGVVLEGRGIIKTIEIIEKIPDVHFVIIGDGEFRKDFESDANKLYYKNRIHFIGAVNHSKLLNYTANADVGLALIENISISYYYALPNKLFEYIMAGIPILCSNLPQMKNIIDTYEVGKYVDVENKKEVIKILNEMLNNKEKLNLYKLNCKKAAIELNWEIEFEKVKNLIT